MQVIGSSRAASSPRIWSRDLRQHIGERIELAGWLHRYRALGQIGFLILRDRTGLAQVVITEQELRDQVASLGHESVLRIKGTVVEEPQAPQGIELHDPEVEVVSAVAGQLPVDLYRPQLNAQLPTILDHSVLTNRHPVRRAYLEIAAALTAGFRTALDRRDFVEIHTPKLVGSATEGGANVFRLDYFGRDAYLAQSPQLYKQIMVGVFERVYETGPVFRAEPHDTSRHLNEYISLDAEFGFIEDERDVVVVLGDTIASMVEAVRSRASAAVDLLEIEIPDVPDEVPMIHFAEAMELLSKELGEDLSGELDLSPAHERRLCEWSMSELGSEWLVVTGYPLEKRPFYTHPDPERPGYSRGFDLLFRGLELVTGGQRLHLYDEYLQALAGRGLSPAPFAEYLECFEFGMPPHGGFAIGLERFVARLAGIENVREVALFPRTMTRLTP